MPISARDFFRIAMRVARIPPPPPPPEPCHRMSRLFADRPGPEWTWVPWLYRWIRTEDVPVLERMLYGRWDGSVVWIPNALWMWEDDA